jgi:hypothetical protein
MIARDFLSHAAAPTEVLTADYADNTDICTGSRQLPAAVTDSECVREQARGCNDFFAIDYDALRGDPRFEKIVGSLAPKRMPQH